MAHSKTVLRLAWHPTQSNILVSGSKDHQIKVWNIHDLTNPIRTITNIEQVDRLKWIPSSRFVDTLGVATVTSDSSIYIWDTYEPHIPKYCFNIDSKIKLTDVSFSGDAAIFSTKTGFLMA